MFIKADVRCGSINGRYQLEMQRPLFPRKQRWIGPARAGKLVELQRFSPGGLFGLSFNFLRMNQAGPAPIIGRDLTAPHRGSYTVINKWDFVKFAGGLGVQFAQAVDTAAVF